MEIRSVTGKVRPPWTAWLLTRATSCVATIRSPDVPNENEAKSYKRLVGRQVT